MFDPRTLPNGDFAYNFATVLWYAVMLADVFVTRWGIWYYGFVEANKLMKWLTANTFRTFLDAGILRPAAVLAFLAVSGWAGVVDRAHSWVPFGLVGITAIWPVKNYLKIRAIKSVKK